MNQVRIKGANLNKEELLLYKADTAETISIPQGDKRIKAIVDEITPILLAGGIATIDLDEQPNDYAAFEKKSNGLVRFFKVAKKAVAHLFGSDAERMELQEKTMGDTTGPNPVTRKVQQVAQATDEILANAISANQPNFTPPLQQAGADEDTGETMIAVVGKGKNARVIPGVEALTDQVTHSVRQGSTEGMTRLIERLGAIIDKRGHSVQDVLRFLERSDLPIANDGSIIAYKILKRKSGMTDTYVDCHTGLIPQKIGSIVRVDESLVDRNRSNECSNGLHIARRGYLGNFSGDVCVLIKLEPENIITVPHGDANKVRVTAYQILGLIPPNEFALLKRNQPMTSSAECQQLLEKALNGFYPRAIEEVLVTAQRGSGVTVTPIGKQYPKAQAQKTAGPTMPPVALDDKKANPIMDIATVSKEVQQKSSETSRKMLALELRAKALDVKLDIQKRKDAAQALIDMKRRTKVSWTLLGITEAEVSLITKILAPEKNAAPKAVKPKVEAKKQEPLPLKIKLPAPEVKLPEKTKAPKQSRDQKVAELLKVIMNGHSVDGRVNAAKQLVALKKINRKSWTAMHVSEKEVEQIQLLTAPVKSGTVHDVKETKPKEQSQKQSLHAVKTPASKAPMSNKERAQGLYLTMKNDKAAFKDRRQAALDLVALKKKAKVGYAELGLNKAIAEALIKKSLS